MGRLWQTMILKEHSLQQYLRAFKEISPATASRDLKLSVNSGILEKQGDKNTVK